MSAQQTINSSEIAALFAQEVPRILLPPDIARRYEQECEDFFLTLDAASLRRRRNEIRPTVNAVFQKVLRGAFDPPLSAYLREIPREVLCFYIERVRGVERSLRLTAQQPSPPIARPASWNEYWMQLLLKH
ncbi:MAG: hypothetical protein HY961_14895 [Ignavibacteriae bacterium]|nr:hypothetical protein [Ignavibacteriota bacterium]